MRIHGHQVSISPEKKNSRKATLNKNLRLNGLRIDPQYCGKLKTLCAYYGKLLDQETLEELDAELSAVLLEAIRRWLKRKQLRV